MNEADTCRKYVTPSLQAAGWDQDPHRINEQVTFTDGRIVVIGILEKEHRIIEIVERIEALLEEPL